MESRVPLPTDNIFKFYALFGLLLLIFSFGSIIYITKSTNSLVFETAVEYETLKVKKQRSVADEARFELLERKLEIAGKDKEKFSIILAFLVLVGASLMAYGFIRWHTKIQPVQDEMARLNLKKLKRELGEDESV